MSQLSSSNGLYNVVNRITKSAKIYYNQSSLEVIIYFIGATQDEIRRLNQHIKAYIAQHRLHMVYDSVVIYN